MGRDRHGPPPGLTHEERKRWQQWRKFVWMEGDIVITKRPGDRKTEEGADGGPHEGRDDERPGGAGAR